MRLASFTSLHLDRIAPGILRFRQLRKGSGAGAWAGGVRA